MESPKDFMRCCNNMLEDSCFDEHVGSTPVAEPAPSEFVCHLCQSSFDTYQALCSHKWVHHSHKNPIRRKLSGTVCLSCRKDFHTRTKLLNHVAYRVQSCKTYYESLPDIDTQIFEQLETKESLRVKRLVKGGFNRNFHYIPCTRLT